jgi:beta-galactosidase
MKYGAAWYPEHWPESRWPEDLAWMKEAKMNVVRVGEFAWSTMEPRNGRFEFGWLNRAVDLCHRAGIEVVMGTPTAAPPAWLTSRYPDTLAVWQDGRTAEHGNRCHFRPWSPRYRKFCARIVAEMARRYGRHPAVTGWQIDNELSTASFDQDARRQFQEWLKTQYRTLENLNSRWSGAYWSEDYSDWRQVPIPRGGHNPGLLIEWKRFQTFTYRTYQQVQVAEIRRYARPEQWITTNFGGWWDQFDHYEMSRDLDLASWDSYCAAGFANPVSEAVQHDLTRGYKRRNFWVMETQPSGVNWAPVNEFQQKGRVRLRNWQAVAHGSNAILYWQWRNALGGQEQLHGSVIGADGRPRPNFPEMCRIGEEFGKAGPFLEGTEPKAEVAFLHSYDARWAINIQRHHKDFDPGGHLVDHYRPFFGRNVTVDIISALEPLAGYSLVVVPCLWLLHDSTARNIEEYAHNGGTVLVTCRTGAKDWENALRPELPPGPLSVVTGVEVEDAFAVVNPVPVRMGKTAGQAKVWVERLRTVARDVKVLATFGKGYDWVEGLPAATVRRVGKGRAFYLAGWLDAPLLEAVTSEAMKAAGIRQRFRTPPGVELASRMDSQGREVVIAMNHTEFPARVDLPRGRDLLKGGRTGGRKILAPRDVMVVLAGGK